MKVRLRRMSEKEFKEFSEYSTNDYAKDLMEESQITLQEALSQAREELLEMLPEGLDTKDNALMIVEDWSDGRAVGIIWYLFEETNEEKQVFLSDFVIKEEERRKGYATAALVEMELDAQRNGCKESVIYVWKHNLPGIKLYTKCGYITFRDLDDGMYMKKEMG